MLLRPSSSRALPKHFDTFAIRRSKFKSMPLLFREMLCCSPVSSKKDLAG